MGRIDDIFSTLRREGGKALMPFVCADHPAPGLTGPILGAMERAGAAIAEVGIPFSDPIADGPVIAAAMHKALTAGSTPRRVFEEVAAARPALSIGLVAMVSVSIVTRLGGPARFAGQARDAGFDGLIVPDCPLEESADLRTAATDAGLCFALLIAPTTPPKRAAEIAKACTGFVYMLARTGITGERREAPDIARRAALLRETTQLPIACGFGISTADHVRAVVAHADAAIVGSALVRRLDDAAQRGHDPAHEAGTMVRELAAGLR
jgi:tryptophan synthase alpha chain